MGPHKKHKKRSTSSSESSSDDDSSRKRTHSEGASMKKKKRLKKRDVSSSSSTDVSSSDSEKKRKLKKLKKLKREKKNKKETEEASADIPLDLMAKSKAMAPMTKEEWEKKQSVVRRVYDESSGRHRLIKGDGEVIEECVSRDRHKSINQQATRGDGDFFQAQMSRRLKK